MFDFFKVVVFVIFAGLILWVSFLYIASTAFAKSVEELQAEINSYNTKIEALEKEIKEYEEQLTTIGTKRQTLQSTVNELDVSRKKISTNITLTQNRISATTLQIEELRDEIGDKGRRIVRDSGAIASAIRRINELETESMIEVILATDNLNEFWDQIESLQRFQNTLRDQVRELSLLKEDLEDTKTASERKKVELTNYRTELAGQKIVLDQTRKEKNALLSETKNQESTYQTLLDERIAAREQFENELLELESELRIAIDPSSIPPFGSGILRWPFADTYMKTCQSFQSYLKNPHCITQYFGNTPFATQNPQVYNGGGHNGIDFRASVGTKVQSALSGTVIETGNTDLQRGCYSYGKWALVRHNNGLSTLYAHLSHISVSSGESVATGSIVGFSGNTGYSTGPHLHFTVFASQGVQVVRLGNVKKITNCGNVRIPIAPLDAYLNPLSYL